MINQAPFDRFSSAHAGVGATMAAAGIPMWAAVGLSVAFEVFENRLKDMFPHVFPYSSHDSVANTVGDTIAIIVGFWAAQRALDRDASDAASVALRAAVGSTLAGLVGAVGGGSTGRGRVDASMVTAAHRGYAAGGALGGAVGPMTGSAPSAPAAVAGGAGGYFAGPAGAATMAFLAQWVANKA